MSRKQAALKKDVPAKVERKTAAAKVSQASNSAKPPPDKFTYALKQYTVERRPNGWWVSRTWTTFAGEKPDWSGPFKGIEDACSAIASQLAIELVDRHNRFVRWYGLEADHPMHGLKPRLGKNEQQPRSKKQLKPA